MAALGLLALLFNSLLKLFNVGRRCLDILPFPLHHIVCFIPEVIAIQEITFIRRVLHHEKWGVHSLKYFRIGDRLEVRIPVKQYQYRWSGSEYDLGRGVVQVGALLHHSLGILEAGVKLVHGHAEIPFRDLGLKDLLELSYLIIAVIIRKTYIQYLHTGEADLPGSTVGCNVGRKPDRTEYRLPASLGHRNRCPPVHLYTDEGVGLWLVHQDLRVPRIDLLWPVSRGLLRLGRHHQD